MRQEKSKWAEKNKALVKRLEEQGLMTDFGIRKIEEAKKNGQWYAPNPMAVTQVQIAQLFACRKDVNPPIPIFKICHYPCKNLYPAYWDAKTEAVWEKRMVWMVAQLNETLRPI